LVQRMALWDPPRLYKEGILYKAIIGQKKDSTIHYRSPPIFSTG
jgi:hypothetical protein